MSIPEFRVHFPGRVLVLGCGSVSQCLQPLLLRHFDMDFRKLTIMDFEDMRSKIPDTLAAGARYKRERITPENIDAVLSKQLSAGDLLMVSVLRRLAGSGLLEGYPNVCDYVTRGESRPAHKRAFEAQLAVFTGKPAGN